ncbi:MAG: hypothetical protein K2Z80_04345 [Xanthobacteraceae bacterium]|nr:hypothetical protein [Xanthobacteraceae bacterium]
MLHRSRPSLLIAALLPGLFMTSPAASQDTTGPPCADHDTIVDFLHTHYGERIDARGLASAGYVVEIFVSPTRSWTIVATPPVGPSCVLTQGIAWDFAIPREQSARR